MKLVKFLDSKHLDIFLSGKLLLRELIYYRLLEKSGTYGEIGDSREGQYEVYIEDKTDGNLKISNSTFFGSDVAFVFCAYRYYGESVDELKEICKLFGYDAAVRIDFAQSMIDSAFNHGLLSNGSKLSDSYMLQKGMVKYHDFSVSQNYIHDNPIFRKNTKFSHQKEFRFALIPLKNTDRRFIGDDLHIEVNSGDIKLTTLFQNIPIIEQKYVPKFNSALDALICIKSSRTAIDARIHTMNPPDTHTKRGLVQSVAPDLISAYWYLRTLDQVKFKNWLMDQRADNDSPLYQWRFAIDHYLSDLAISI